MGLTRRKLFKLLAAGPLGKCKKPDGIVTYLFPERILNEPEIEALRNIGPPSWPDKEQPSFDVWFVIENGKIIPMLRHKETGLVCDGHDRRWRLRE